MHNSNRTTLDNTTTEVFVPPRKSAPPLRAPVSSLTAAKAYCTSSLDTTKTGQKKPVAENTTKTHGRLKNNTHTHTHGQKHKTQNTKQQQEETIRNTKSKTKKTTTKKTKQLSYVHTWFMTASCMIADTSTLYLLLMLLCCCNATINQTKPNQTKLS